MKLVPLKNASQKVSNAFEVENELAKIQLSRIESRDPEKIYNPYSKTELYNLGQGYWDEWIGALGLEGQDRFIVESPSYISSVIDLMTKLPIEKWKDYLIVRLVKGSANSLSDEFVRESFEFSKALTGREKLPDLWKRGVGVINGIMGDALGKVYVNEYFPPEYKSRVDELVSNLLESFRKAIKELEWITDLTKKKAL